MRLPCAFDRFVDFGIRSENMRESRLVIRVISARGRRGGVDPADGVERLADDVETGVARGGVAVFGACGGDGVCTALRQGACGNAEGHAAAVWGGEASPDVDTRRRSAMLKDSKPKKYTRRQIEAHMR